MEMVLLQTDKPIKGKFPTRKRTPKYRYSKMSWFRILQRTHTLVNGHIKAIGDPAAPAVKAQIVIPQSTSNYTTWWVKMNEISFVFFIYFFQADALSPYPLLMSSIIVIARTSIILFDPFTF